MKPGMFISAWNFYMFHIIAAAEQFLLLIVGVAMGVANYQELTNMVKSPKLGEWSGFAIGSYLGVLTFYCFIRLVTFAFDKLDDYLESKRDKRSVFKQIEKEN
jgi:hypothetical protein